MRGILHIPHASTFIPKEYLNSFKLSQDELNHELLLMTDHFINELFTCSSSNFETLSFPVSRLLVDPERFEDDTQEIMSKVGMGCIYKMTHDGKPLKNVELIRKKLLEKFYRPHHAEFNSMVKKILTRGQTCLIIDCHSFPCFPLPYELNQKPKRAEICIGTDDFHTPKELSMHLQDSFKKKGYSVSENEPFSGSIVPTEYWRKTKEVASIMIEIRRDLYMDEKTGKKIENFANIKETIGEVIDIVSVKDNEI